ncbi:SAM-dependent methyltransferase [Polycladidibacter stylochi]|uniref:SAM-dependent methyltransferase n=1 Tax=Polycladidibacter stylochi TaxID=1807766 RepID=UPI000831D7F9|nr:SAM-dependent methyltransferase [Pseudovibrio stylochi]
MTNTINMKVIGCLTANNNGFAIKINDEYKEALLGLNKYSHLHVVWVANEADNKYLICKKPYTKSTEDYGVFASRSPLRPNPICISIAQIIDVDMAEGRITVPYIDCFDGTKIIDIKPYNPSSDLVEEARVPEQLSHWPKSYEASGEFDWSNEFTY